MPLLAGRGKKANALLRKNSSIGAARQVFEGRELTRGKARQMGELYLAGKLRKMAKERGFGVERAIGPKFVLAKIKRRRRAKALLALRRKEALRKTL